MPRAGLTTEGVVDAASAIADAEGLKAVTLARLAEALGIRSPSLYKHVDSLDAIRRALAVRGIRERTPASSARRSASRATRRSLPSPTPTGSSPANSPASTPPRSAPPARAKTTSPPRARR